MNFREIALHKELRAMKDEKWVKLKIGTTVKFVPESQVQKWVENQQQVVNELVSRGANREEAGKYFKAEIIR